ncbi:MAG TPA: ABC transporter ATP-binding protein [Gammaproteobacteria bacterium]|nr:ABC transporter ATP-binding protein [Gammaproteobacteria bacterium]
MVKQQTLTPPSILSAIFKLRDLLTKKEKLNWLGIALFALTVSVLEVLTASIIVIFAQILNDPASGKRYFNYLGITQTLSPGKMVFYAAVIFGLIYLFKNIVAAAEVFFQNFSIQRMCYTFKNKLLERYSKIDYGFYLTRNSSYGLNVISGDAEQSFTSGMTSMASVLSEGIVFVCLISMIVYMNPGLAFILAMIGFSVSLILIRFVFPYFYDWGKKLQDCGIKTAQHLMQFFHAFKEILLLGKHESFINDYRIYSHQKSKIQAMQTATNALPRMGVETLFVGIFVLSTYYLCLNNDAPISVLGVLSGYLYVGFRLMPGLNRIINQLNTFKSIIPNIERVHKEYFTMASEQHYIHHPSFQFSKSISLRNLDFQYLNTEKNALNNINLTIMKGESIGLIGKTGSGKSTLIDLILGLLKPSKGSVLIDETHPVNAFQWHQMIGYVPQAVYLTDDTIAANIAFGEQDIDEDKLNHAIDAAQLRGFIDSLPNTTEAIVGERGIRLSGGERQRISIARALYHNPEVLIFDEATSALDNETESRLMKTINDVSKDRTVIMVAHRLTTLKDCDRIIELEHGKVIHNRFK